MSTAQELVDLGAQLNSFATSINDFIDGQPDPGDAQFAVLRDNQAKLAAAASDVASLAMQLLAPDIAAATRNLTTQVQTAQNVLATVQKAEKAVQIISAILKVAVAAATGNPFGTVAGVGGLVTAVQAAVA